MKDPKTCDHMIKYHTENKDGTVWVYVEENARELWPQGCCPLCGEVFE